MVKFGRISGADPSKQANTGTSVSPKAFNKLNATTKINEGRINEKGRMEVPGWKRNRGAGNTGGVPEQLGVRGLRW